jgi:hypothetical protein
VDDLRAEHAAREADAWEEFEAALERVPAERWSELDVIPGWTVKEMLWHVAGWLTECAEHLEKMAAGTFENYEEDDAATDARNAAFAEAARGMDVDTVRRGLFDARHLVLRRWEDLPEIDDVAVEWFAGETYEHYDEHLADLDLIAG